MKAHPKIIDRIIEGIQGSQTICIAGHIRPDGDCVGSQLGLAVGLRNAGKKVVCWNEDLIPDKYRFLDPDRLFQKPKSGLEFDCVIATDAASFVVSIAAPSTQNSPIGMSALPPHWRLSNVPLP